jgi:DNA-binding CsgD family transcriptional regulator
MTASGVEYHIDNMRLAFGATNRNQLIAELFRRGILT